MIRLLLKRIRSGIRVLSGADEDRISMWNGFRELTEQNAKLKAELETLALALDDTRTLMAKGLECRSFAGRHENGIHDAEFKVFSQFGDDGIVQHLIRTLKIEPATFIEFGVGDYSESNTRYLLMNNNWKGLILEGDASAVAKIRADRISCFYDLTAVSAFITRDNVNQLFERQGFSGPLGILSVDVDGNDYWIWEAITVVDPVVVICEYNSVFGADRAITVPYDPAFVRGKAHFSHLYYGASLKALCLLAARKGYAFVGSNSSGNNAYFVKRERLAGLRELSAEKGWVESRFRESKDRDGQHTFLSGADRLKVMSGCSVYDIDLDAVVSLQN
jgi:hypothetical protein